jgi:hypothetical protein
MLDNSFSRILRAVKQKVEKPLPAADGGIQGCCGGCAWAVRLRCVAPPVYALL